MPKMSDPLLVFVNMLLIFVNRFRRSILTPLLTLPDANSSTVTVYSKTCQQRSSFGPGLDVKTQNCDSPCGNLTNTALLGA